MNIGIVGATGVVGKELIKLLEIKNFPFNNLTLLASERSAGLKFHCKNKEYEVQVLNEENIKNIDILFFTADKEISIQYVPIAVKHGSIVIDNSSAFRLEKSVPLIVPECNVEDIDLHQGIIANPNCSTIQMVHALQPIDTAYQIKRVIVSTYQAVSGGGTPALNELLTQVKDYVDGKELQISAFTKQILFNVIPHIDYFHDNGFTNEEMKMVLETKKILHNDSIAITPTCVRVPVLRSHSESIYLETEKSFQIQDIIKLFEETDAIKVMNGLENSQYPTPIDVSEKFETFVGRIRKDLSHPNALNFWCVSDQLYKGAALNALQIAEKLIEKK